MERLNRAIAAAALVILAPVMLIIMLLIRITMGSPVLFKQVRPGLRGKPFTMYKFRTMIDERRETSIRDEAERITAIGGFLRKTSLDELPELFNVLRGEMNFIGPRPLLMEYLPLYTREQARRHEIKPGITGLAQVSGRNAIRWEEKFKLDLFYIDHRTFLLDARILWLTVRKVLAREGISQAGRGTMEKFRGTESFDDKPVQNVEISEDRRREADQVSLDREAQKKFQAGL